MQGTVRRRCASSNGSGRPSARSWGWGPDPRSVELYEQILALEGTEPSTLAERAASHLSAGLVALNRMELDEAERQARLALAEFSLFATEGPEKISAYAHELEGIADRFGSIGGRALARLMLGESKMLDGDLAGAEVDLSVAAELHGRAGASTGRALSLERLALAAVARGRLARAGRLLADAHALALSSSLASHLVVRVYGTKVQAAARDPVAAAEVARSSRNELAGNEVCEPCSIGLLVSSTIAFARIRSLQEAVQCLDHAERVAGMWQGGPLAGSGMGSEGRAPPGGTGASAGCCAVP